jgi:hypothetical protein
MQIQDISKGLTSKILSSWKIPDQLLLNIWMRKTALWRKNPTKRTLFVTNHGAATETIGDVQIGNLLYQVDRVTCLILRISGQRLWAVGELRLSSIRLPRNKVFECWADYSWEDQYRKLFFDYTALRAFSLYFRESMKN